MIENEDRITLDDYVSALRAVFVHNEYPYVSIDGTEDTNRTGKLKVVFKGGVEGTGFGRDLLAADILLKLLSLGEVPSEPWGVQSYLGLYIDHFRKNSAELEDRIGSRFWFFPKNLVYLY